MTGRGRGSRHVTRRWRNSSRGRQCGRREVALRGCGSREVTERCDCRRQMTSRGCGSRHMISDRRHMTNRGRGSRYMISGSRYMTHGRRRGMTREGHHMTRAMKGGLLLGIHEHRGLVVIGGDRSRRGFIACWL